MSSGDGEITFHVRDGSLGTIHSCVAMWDGVRFKYGGPGNQDIFNVRTGEPEPDVFTTNSGCTYDEYSRLATNPAPEAFDDGVGVQISYEPVNFADTEVLKLVDYVIEAGSRFEVRYYFHVVDIYDADAERAHVTFPYDTGGEWADLKEVSSEMDAEPSAYSGLFQGKTKVSRNPDVRGRGDGSVWVPVGGSVKVTYLDEEGIAKATSNTSPPPSPTPIVSPTPTNVPGLYGDPYPTPTLTVVPGPPRRNVSVAFANTPQRSGDTAVFHIRDNYLGTTGDCAVKWADIPHEVGATDPNDDKLFMPWNVVIGDPVPSVFSREGCDYDGSTALAAPLGASVDGREVSPAVEDGRTGNPPQYGLVSIRTKAPKGSTVRIDFHYEVVDAFPAQAKRARVYSSSDREGEWVAIREVASESDDSPAAASYLYRGEIEISEDAASKAAGDGKVFVRKRSRLSVVYYDVGGAAEPKKRASVGLDLPTATPSPQPTATPVPTPTPIPAVNPLLLILGVGAAILIALIDRRRSKAQNG